MGRISQDVALSILNTLRVKCIVALDDDTSLSQEEKEILEERNKLLAYEERVVYGLEGDKKIKEVVLDKIDRFYSPEVKAIYEQG